MFRECSLLRVSYPALVKAAAVVVTRVALLAEREKNMAIGGSCLCKAVQYEVDELASPIGFCHCLTCQKAHAANFAPTARVKREQFRWLQGQDFVRAFVSSPGKARHFCSLCGSHIVAIKEGQEELILRVATLDGAPNTSPVVHIWTSHDRAWLSDRELPAMAEGLR